MTKVEDPVSFKTARILAEEIERLNKRVNELLLANNQEVERRREAERRLEAYLEKRT